MSYRNNFYDIALDAINEAVAETFEMTATERRPHRMPCTGMFEDQPSGLRHFQ